MDILEKLFGSAAKVKIMRLFLFNPDTPFDLVQVVNKSRITEQAARLHIRLLHDIGLLKARIFTRALTQEEKREKASNSKKKKKGKKKNQAPQKQKPVLLRKKVKGWVLNENFSYLEPLQSFLIHVSPLQDQMLIRKFNKTGKIRLLIVSGVFIQEKESRVDVLVVGDGLRKTAVQSTIKDIEADLGKELTYSVFETNDFQYRLGMYDKLVRDILDYPHKKLINRLAIE